MHRYSTRSSLHSSLSLSLRPVRHCGPTPRHGPSLLTPPLPPHPAPPSAPFLSFFQCHAMSCCSSHSSLYTLLRYLPGGRREAREARCEGGEGGLKEARRGLGSPPALLDSEVAEDGDDGRALLLRLVREAHCRADVEPGRAAAADPLLHREPLAHLEGLLVRHLPHQEGGVPVSAPPTHTKVELDENPDAWYRTTPRKSSFIKQRAPGSCHPRR